MALGDVNLTPASAVRVIRQGSSSSAGNSYSPPGLNYPPETPSLPPGKDDPSRMSVCSRLPRRCGPQPLRSLASQPPANGSGAVGQGNQRAGNRLIIDENGDKTTALLNSAAVTDRPRIIAQGICFCLFFLTIFGLRLSDNK